MFVIKQLAFIFTDKRNNTTSLRSDIYWITQVQGKQNYKHFYQYGNRSHVFQWVGTSCMFSGKFGTDSMFKSEFSFFFLDDFRPLLFASLI